jgi:tripartite-type tricarboxylate transporter receptor subunit TctC
VFAINAERPLSTGTRDVKTFRGFIFGAAVVLFCIAGAQAQPYPNHVIRIVVPFPAGGLNDNVARIVQPFLQEELGQSVIIENRSGASGIVGTDIVTKSAPDGYTVAVVASSHTVTPATNAKLPYDTVHDLAAVGLLMRDPLLFIVGDQVPARTLSEFVALARSQPGKLNYSTPGTASQSHFVTELFDERAGIKMTEIPYRGGAPAMLALLSGEAQFAVLSTQLSSPQIKAGKIRPLASGGRVRDGHFPDVPTLAESGFPGLEALQWVGMLAPAKTPKDVIAKLNGALQKVLARPDVVERFTAQGVTAASSSPEEFQTLIETEVKQWTEVAQKSGTSAADK